MMLGLFPYPERTDLKPVTASLIGREFTVENSSSKCCPELHWTGLS
ncbi:MAG: hypothetical protein QM813_21470 [Verrucomicrobiota bacterium]